MSGAVSTKRIVRVQAALRRRKIDALLVSQPENRRYLSGYTATDHSIQESSGFLLLPARGLPFLLTDSRFTLQAEEEAPGFQIEIYRQGLVPHLERLLPRLGIRSLAFESGYFIFSAFQRLAAMGQRLELSLIPVEDLIEKMRVVKDEAELELLRRSSHLNEKVFQSAYKTIAPGMTEREIALALEMTMRRLGAEGPSFDTIVAFGENAAKPHAMPTDRRLQSGDLVMIDMGLVCQGYCSDLTRTFVIGPPGGQFIERHRLVRRAMLAGIRAIRAGVECAEVDQAARRVLDEAGYGGCFGHALGHGVGLAVHEEPRLSPRSRKKLQAGMVVTVEPGIYFADWGGIRLEKMVIVHEDGAEVINADTTSLDL